MEDNEAYRQESDDEQDIQMEEQAFWQDDENKGDLTDEIIMVEYYTHVEKYQK